MDAPSSPFASVIGTNYAPSDAEISDIRIICFQKQEEIQTLDREIHGLQKTLGDLKARRQDLQESLESHQALTSPIRRIFPEILQLIFKFCLPSTRNVAMLVTEAPMVLGRVCSRWRQVAYVTPEIWAKIHIVVPPVHSPLMQLRLDAVREWIDRSGSFPLSISIDVDYAIRRLHPAFLPLNFIHTGDELLGSEPVSQNPILRFIHDQLSRCIVLAIHAPSIRMAELLSAFPAGDDAGSTANAPSLLRCEIITNSHEAFGAPTTSDDLIFQMNWITLLVQSSESLREVSYHGIGVPSIQLAVIPKLTYLRLSLSLKFGEPELLELLQQTMNLRHLEVANVLYRRDAQANGDVPRHSFVQLIHLTHLSILDNFIHHANNARFILLDYLILPSLEAFSVSLNPNITSVHDPYPMMQRCISRSGCFHSLRKMHCFFSSKVPDTFASLAAECSAITSLSLAIHHCPGWFPLFDSDEEGTHSRDDGSILLELLTDPHLLPNLQELHILDTESLKPESTLLSGMIIGPFLQARLSTTHASTTAFRSLTVHPPAWTKEDDFLLIDPSTVLPPDIMDTITQNEVDVYLGCNKPTALPYKNPMLGVEISEMVDPERMVRGYGYASQSSGPEAWLGFT
jgi:hypothetical protein